jgi:hypothetical protein
MVKVSKEFQMVRMNRKIGRHTINGVSANGVNWWVDQRQYHLPGLFMAFPKDAMTFLNHVLSLERVAQLGDEYPELFPRAGRRGRPAGEADSQWVRDALEDQDARSKVREKTEAPLRASGRAVTNNRVRHVK